MVFPSSRSGAELILASPQRIGFRCFVAWCVAVAFVLAAALAQGVQLSELVSSPDVDGHISLWQALVFSLSMSAFGLWMGLTTKPRRIPEDPAGIAFHLKRFAKIGGWISAIGGIIGVLRILSLIQNQ